MLHVLLVSTSEKTTGILKEYLNMEDCMNITACKTASRARRTALETAFDTVSYTHLTLPTTPYV